MASLFRALLLAALLLALLPAQTFNVNFSSTGAAPPADFGGVGRPGVWNSLPGVHTVHYPVVDQSGASVGVTMRNFGGMNLLSGPVAQLSPDEAALCGEYLVTYNALETCIRFLNLPNGSYRVITYAWNPAMPAVPSRVTCDETNEPSQLIGGSWPGGFQQGVTHAVHLANVTAGELNVHSGLAPGQGVAALNAIQIHRLGPADGTVGLGSGGPYDVLTVDGSTGDATRSLVLSPWTAATVDVATTPGSGGAAHYVLLGLLGSPGPQDLTPLPGGTGTLLFPPCLTSPLDARLFTLASSVPLGPCPTVFPTMPAPVSLTLPPLPSGLQFTLHGVIETGPAVFRTVNALTVIVS